MADITSDLVAWGELCNETANRLNATNFDRDDEEFVDSVICDLDQAAASCYGLVQIVMNGPDMILFDEDGGVAYDKPAQVLGVFKGAQAITWDDEIQFGFRLRTDNDNIITHDKDDKKDLPAIKTAMGLVATTHVWAPNDVFSSRLTLEGDGLSAPKTD
jgi:hypothetical protein